MTALDNWLKQAARGLSKDSAAQVRSEIQQHYESAREAALRDGASADDAGRSALTALGRAGAANCQYRKVLLTSAEARLLRDSNCEARAVCSRPWLKRLLLAMPAATLVASLALFFNGAFPLARVLFLGGIMMGFFLAPPFLPIYTPSRARVFRHVKWLVLIGAPVLALGPHTLQSFWLLLWPLAWIEWTRSSIRRKLPVARWPKQLYL